VDPAATRQQSLVRLAALGFPRPPEWLPLRDEWPERTLQEVVDRALGLNVFVAVAYGMPKQRAREWLQREAIRLTPAEETFFSAADLDTDAINRARWKVESLGMLAWTLGVLPKLQWDEPLPDDLSHRVPHLHAGEDARRFRTEARLRPPGELSAGLDLAYCLTWGLVELKLQGGQPPAAIDPGAVWERRGALEWLCDPEVDWDDPPMDT
jgi:hypothetical protein